jgi:ubiquinone/menaquinone biosynthesis C-methylase UbiE
MGVTMHPEFQKIFVVPGSHELLIYEGTMDGSRWKNGILRTMDNKYSYPVREGVPDFVPPSVGAWSEKEMEEIRKGDWIRRNWEYQMKQMQTMAKRVEFCRQIAECNGTILDVASGPGGGNMPGILYFNPEARILMNDLGASVLHEWRVYLKKNGLGPNVSFAGFDATNMPISSNVFDIVSSAGGFGNIAGSDRAINEAYRVLKKGGVLFMSDGRVTQKSLAQLPKSVQTEWKRRLPYLESGYKKLLRKAGFSIVSYYETDAGILHPEGSELGTAAAKHGVTLYFVGCYAEAEKR